MNSPIPRPPRFPRPAPSFPRPPAGRARLALTALALLLACWFVAPAARAGSPGDLDRENGLPDAKLGTPVEAFRGLELIEETGRWTSYRRPGERLRFGKYDLSSVTYNFFKGKLYSIFMDVEGRANTRGILRTLEATYGRDHTLEKHPISKTDVTMEVREWVGSKVYLLYKNGDNFAGGQITLLDKPAWDLIQVPKQEQAAELRKMMQGSYLNGDF